MVCACKAEGKRDRNTSHKKYRLAPNQPCQNITKEIGHRVHVSEITWGDQVWGLVRQNLKYKTSPKSNRFFGKHTKTVLLLVKSLCTKNPANVDPVQIWQVYNSCRVITRWSQDTPTEWLIKLEAYSFTAIPIRFQLFQELTAYDLSSRSLKTIWNEKGELTLREDSSRSEKSHHGSNAIGRLHEICHCTIVDLKPLWNNESCGIRSHMVTSKYETGPFLLVFIISHQDWFHTLNEGDISLKQQIFVLQLHLVQQRRRTNFNGSWPSFLWCSGHSCRLLKVRS